jgi:hypothetical protein
VSGVWSARLAPRRCTSDVQCLSFVQDATQVRGVGLSAHPATCVYDAADYVQWRQGDPAWSGSLAVGDEGGCACDASGALGFLDRQLFCTACADGYGPFSQADWILVAAQQARLLAMTGPGVPLLFDATAYPFAGLIAASGQAQIDVLNATVYCRIPANAKSDGHFCGGYGTVRYYALPDAWSSIALYRVPGAKPVVLTPMCTSLTVDGVFLAGTIVDSGVYVYVSGDGSSGVNVVDGTAYFWSGGGGVPVAGIPRSCSSTIPVACAFDLVRTDILSLIQVQQTVAVTCANAAFFAPPYHVDTFLGGVLLKPRTSQTWSMVLEGLV